MPAALGEWVKDRWLALLDVDGNLQAQLLLTAVLPDGGTLCCKQAYRAARVVKSSRWGRACIKVEMLVTSCMALARGLAPVGAGASTRCCSVSTTTCNQ